MSASDTAPVLEVSDLTVDFSSVEGTVRAIDSVGFRLFPRRTLGVVGESGCGKSVTARAIMRLEERRNCRIGGRILLHRDGNSLDLAKAAPNSRELRAVRGREIGLVFQEPMTSFSPVHTVGNQIMEAALLHLTGSKKEAYAISLKQLQSVGMPHPEHIMEQYSAELSGGLRQRAMIAMALVCGPRVLIADEPTTALDVTTQAEVLSLLKELQAMRRMAMMLITHDLGVVAEVAHDVVIMYLGRIVERGSVESVLSRPKHPYTQLLLKARPSIARKSGGPLEMIRGSVPRAEYRPTGCAFHTRCPMAIPAVCDSKLPGITRVSEQHVVHCHLYSDDSETVGSVLPDRGQLP